MSDSERLKRGKAEFDRTYGEGGAENLIENFGPIGRDLARYGIEFNFGDIYARPGLNLRDREMCTIAALVMMGGVDPQIRGHTGAALDAGMSAEEVAEVIIHTVQYSGFPRALNALKVANEVFAERGIEPQEDQGGKNG